MQKSKVIEQTLTSMEVAEMMGREHNNVMKDLRKYNQYLGAVKINHSDFWRESTYITEQNKKLKCYNITKKGCEFLCHKMTGEKGAIFTARYINRFHDMEEAIVNGKTELSTVDSKALLTLVNEQAEMINKQNELLNQQADVLEKQSDMFHEFSKTLSELRIELRESGKSFQRKTGVSFSGTHTDENTMLSRTKRLNMFIGKLAKLSASDKSDVYCSLYTEIERKFDVSLDSFVEVLKAEYRGTIHTINVVAYWNDFYDFAFGILDNAVSKYSTFDREDLL